MLSARGHEDLVERFAGELERSSSDGCAPRSASSPGSASGWWRWRPLPRPGAPGYAGLEILVGIAVALIAWSVLVFWLLRRFPAREVGIVSTVVEMAAVTIAVYVAVDAPDLYLLYGLVILGAALRFGLGAAVWSSIVMTGMYLAVVLPGDRWTRRAWTHSPFGSPTSWDSASWPGSSAGSSSAARRRTRSSRRSCRGGARARADAGARAAQPARPGLRRVARAGGDARGDRRRLGTGARRRDPRLHDGRRRAVPRAGSGRRS